MPVVITKEDQQELKRRCPEAYQQFLILLRDYPGEPDIAVRYLQRLLSKDYIRDRAGLHKRTVERGDFTGGLHIPPREFVPFPGRPTRSPFMQAIWDRLRANDYVLTRDLIDCGFNYGQVNNAVRALRGGGWICQGMFDARTSYYCLVRDCGPICPAVSRGVHRG
jgi:hypothetical protein